MKSGSPLVAVADGPDCPAIDPDRVVTAFGLADYRLLLGWTLREPEWVDRVPPGTLTVMGGYGLSRAVAGGHIAYLPVRLSVIPRLLARRLRPSIAVVAGRPAGKGFVFASSVGWALAAVRAADYVVVELSDYGPPLDTPPIEGSIVDAVPRTAPPDPPPRLAVTDAERRIGEFVAQLIPDGATLQHGPGVIGAAVLAAIQRPVRIHSGLVTGSLIELDRRGLLVGRAETTYLWGDEALSALAAEGRIRVRPVEEIFDPGRLSRIERFIAVNTAVQVGLDGSINVERDESRPIAGIGGHADFCAAARQSPDGLSIIAVRSAREGRSTIVPHPAVVSTPRCDVDVVVTEYGVADLRDVDEGVRADRLVSVAAPEHRDALARAARQSVTWRGGAVSK